MNITEITVKKETTPKIIRLAAYCRVSSSSDDQLHSFAAQIRYYKDYERNNPQYKLVDIYADEGLSGTSMEKRDELHRLLRDCAKGRIDRIIAKSVSRFARNTQELLTVLRTLKELSVSVYFEEQGIDTDKLNSEMIVTFPGMAAQQESISISQNMRWSYKKRMERGEFNCCTPAYGYCLKDGQITINEAEAPAVRRIFELYLQGMGMQTIANILNSEGVPRPRGSGKWYQATIGYILSNERYRGDAVLQKKYTTDTLPFKRCVNHGERVKYYIENANPVIISQAIYDKAQAMRNRKKCSIPRSSPPYALSRMLLCSDCGRIFRRLLTNGVPYWVCSSTAKGESRCTSRRVKEASVYEAFMSMAGKLKENRKYLLDGLIQGLEMLQTRFCGEQSKVKEADKEIADLAARNVIVARLHTNGILNNVDYEAQASEINYKIRKLREERKRLLTNDEDDNELSELKELNKIIEEYEPENDAGTFDGELFGRIVKSVTVISNSALRFNLTGGIELTEEISERGRCTSK